MIPPSPPSRDASPGPLLSVILVTARSFRSLRRTLLHLSEQTVRDRIEILIVAPGEASLADMPPGALSPFWGHQVLPVGEIENGDKQAVAAIRAARAPYLGFVEDHAWLEPSWAEAMVRALDDGWTGVVSRIENANPGTGASWGSYLIAYGTWFGPQPSRPVTQVSRHNVALRRDALLALEPGLEDQLGRDGNLVGVLSARGARFYASTGTSVAHVNASRWSSTFLLRYHGGRLSAWKRWRRGWSVPRRLAYVAACPLFPALRYWRIRSELRARDAWRLVPPRGKRGLLATLLVDALGQLVGFALGASAHSIDYLAGFEMDRAQHLRRRELGILEPPERGAPA